jgi:hypothetical protein
MSKLITFLIAILPTVASAECYMRSATVNDSKLVITRVVDIQRFVTPAANNQMKCVVTFRAEINHVWNTGEGTSMGSASDSIDQICSQALNAGRSYILQKIGGAQVTSEQEMICTDRPELQVKTVRIGDVVQLSELAPDPKEPNFFQYKGTQCRKFVETDFDTKKRDLFQWRGVVCLVRKGEWQVIDKY